MQSLVSKFADRLAWRNVLAALLAAGGAIAVAQCSAAPAAPTRAEAIFRVRVCRGSLHAPEGEVFRILLRDTQLIAQARALVAAGNRKIVSGVVAAGDGGFNAPWPWHLDSGSIQFVDVAAEICDGCASGFERSIGQRICPWTSEIIAEDR